MSQTTAIPADYPRFDAINPDEVAAAFERDLQTARFMLDTLTGCLERPDFDNTIAALDRVVAPIMNAEGMADVAQCHLPDDTFSEVGGKLTQDRLGFLSEVFQNATLFQRVSRVPVPNEAGKAALYARIKDKFDENGIGLPENEKRIFNANQAELTRLATQFKNNVNAAVHDEALIVPLDADLSGMLPDDIARARETAEKRKVDGYVFALSYTDYAAVVDYAQNRDLRERMTRAFADRAAKANVPLVREIVRLRREQANLLGFDTYADWKLSRGRMATSPQQVHDLMGELAEKAMPAARRELAEVADFAKQRDGLETFERWDLPYYNRLLLEQKFNIDKAKLKEYLPLPQVLEGLKKHIKRFYGYDMVERPDLPVIDPAAVSFEVVNGDKTIGYLQLDMLERPGLKQDGGWCIDFRPYQIDASGAEHLPVVVMGMNYAPAADGKPVLLDFDDVGTLFHEMGHAVHALAHVPYRMVSSFNVALDSIELPSTIMENYAREPALIAEYMRHYQTGEPIDPAVLANIDAMEKHGIGMWVAAQLRYNAVDMAAHGIGRGRDIPQDWTAFENETIASLSLFEPMGSFSGDYTHVFANMYAAGYYSYAWAYILEQDMFAAIKATGDLYDPKLTRVFRDEVVGVGAARPASEFLPTMCNGRTQPDIKPLLARWGLLQQPA